MKMKLWIRFYLSFCEIETYLIYKWCNLSKIAFLNIFRSISISWSQWSRTTRSGHSRQGILYDDNIIYQNKIKQPKHFNVYTRKSQQKIYVHKKVSQAIIFNSQSIYKKKYARIACVRIEIAVIFFDRCIKSQICWLYMHHIDSLVCIWCT